MKLPPFVENNLFAIFTALAIGGWGIFLLYMDDRHDAAGTAATQATMLEIRSLKQQIREKQAYETADPGSKYSQARQMLIQEMQDDVDRLELEMKEVP